MKRTVGYTWRLRELMAARGKFTATELVPLLHERSINLSASQIHRLVSGTPERLSLQVLSALVRHPRLHPSRPGRHHRRERRGQPHRHRRPARPDPGNVAKLRPRPARILPEA